MKGAQEMIVYKKQAKKDLGKLPKNTRVLILSKINQLFNDPASLKQNIKPLKGSDNYRLRVGNYRVIYNRKGVILNIWRIAPRSAAYN